MYIKAEYRPIFSVNIMLTELIKTQSYANKKILVLANIGKILIFSFDIYRRACHSKMAINYLQYIA